ncbi:MAG: hypothetical protein CVV06_13260 [Gammaproteobacteria bacterium HGW-Gammaproteobacteria-10]|uniref:Uncharacterized protein n=1 Tax=Methylotuvimicrobium buryatense TaxID=95641 RepID=A0A4P9UMP1_METBY|nr:hypothetical protein [Methylotuvimicrobium buryatense]PKM36007.1 MAG: hypothetical protein CVV06_13260 [Gammaproteobacteria bacterium HGW-Gammaproteobacteria-10]QCW82602.1 hypothetical protein EQU24_10425 [Methylotuvimicrobium buryatense]
MKDYDRNCAVCRLMRSLAFSGLGMGIGGGVAYLFGASRETITMVGIVTAAIIVFGIIDRKKKP